MIALDQDILAGAAIGQVRAIAIAHRAVVAGKPDRDAVCAQAILCFGVVGVVNIDDRYAIRAHGADPAGRQQQALDQQQRRRVVVALWALALLERGALKLDMFDQADLTHGYVTFY